MSAFGRCAWLGLAWLLACEDTHPTLQAPVPRVRSSASASPPSAGPTSAAANLDPPPRVVADEDRLRQVKVGKAIVIDSKGKWWRHCLIHRTCSITPRALSACPAGQDAKIWAAAFAEKAPHLTDPRVAIQGRLVMDDSAMSSAVGCEKGVCCNGRSAKMALAGPPYDLELVGLGCHGDESRLCCALSASGESVIARGLLRYERGRLLLDSPEVCRVVE